jgi:hypothetical protein
MEVRESDASEVAYAAMVVPVISRQVWNRCRISCRLWSAKNPFETKPTVAN